MNILESINQKKGAFIIAEVGVNYYDIAKEKHISELDAAKLMIEEAAKAGADAVKFQTYKAEKIVSKNSPAYWDQTEEPTTSQYELFKKFDHFGSKEYEALAEHSAKIGTIFCSTPFDFEAADFLEPLMPFYKISSSDLTNLPFIAYMAEKGKPILLSTGAADIGEIDRAVNTLRASGNDQFALFHCVLDYPTKYENANLNMIRHLGNIYPGRLIGFSDHTRPDPTMMTLTCAFLYGAKIIEKHFTLNKSLKGNDHYHAMDPADLRTFVSNLALIEKVSGSYEKRLLPCESESRKQARRSIVAKTEILKGTAISLQNVSFKRPGTGISPADFDKVNGRIAKQTIVEDALLTWDDV